MELTKPILFNTEMVKAILEGRKTQTRRIVKPQPEWDGISGHYVSKYDYARSNWPICPGDILWVRETWRPVEASSAGWCRIEYKAGGTEDFKKVIADLHYQEPWHPSIHMPKEAARIFLRVKDVRVERLWDMDEEAAITEGFADSPTGTDSPLERFSALWDKTVKRDDLREYGYHANPWVWVIEFERIEKPEGWCET